MKDDTLESIVVLNNAIYKELQVLKASLSEVDDFKIMHIVCLYSIAKSDDTIYSATLSDVAHLDKAAISRALKDLEENHFIKKKFENDSKYKAKLSLTKKGREEAAKINLALQNASNGILSTFTEEERLAFVALLDKFNIALRDYRAASIAL